MSIRSTLRIFLLVPLACHLALCQQPEYSHVDARSIFVERCAKCHGEHGEGVSAAVSIAGPCLQAEHDHGEVMTALETGPSHMPNFSYLLSVEQMRAVAEYVTQQIAVIPLGGGDLGEGGELFRVYCASCHRTAVRGGALAFTEINAPDLTEKSPAIIAGAIRWGPGPMPAFPASVLNDEQLNSIVKYVRFVQHPPSPGGSPLNWYGPVAEGFVAWIAVFIVIAITGWIEKGRQG